MSNTAWECPRCGKMNAPFNPSCFCKPKEKSESIEDALGYLTKHPSIPGSLPAWLPFGYKRTDICLICGGYHACGASCVTLKVE